MKQIDWIGRGTWMKVDTHIHSRFSDGAHSISEIARKALEYGCDAIAITDHADRDRQAATDQYFEELRAARWQYPSLLILPGLEWNVPPFGGDEHATVLVADEFESALTEFKAEFDDHGRPEHSSQRAADGLRWLKSHSGNSGLMPVVMLEHPSRQRDSSLDLVSVVKELREVGDVVVGISGAPGHQAGEPNGGYTGREKTIDRWDPAVARPGDAWDRLLQAGLDLWGASAPSDYHQVNGTTWNDYWPGQFSETWAYVPERTSSGLLQALRAGSFFGVHGQIARDVRLEVEVDGLYRPAQSGESIEVTAHTDMTVTLTCQVPEKDWAGKPNQIDEIELILVTDEDASVVASAKPDPSGVTRLISTSVPSSNCILRARGRRVIPDGPDLLFYTNPIRLVVGHQSFFAGASTAPVRLWGGVSLGLLALVSLIRNGMRAGKRPIPIPSRKSRGGRRSVHRMWFLGMAIGCGLFAIYGSLLPFNFQSLPWDEAKSRLLRLDGLPTGSSGRIDFLVNAMLFVPIGFGLMGWTRGSLNRPVRTLVLVPLILVLSGLLSVGIECAQVWLPGRVSSLSDVTAQLAGAAIGMVVWLMAGGSLENWLTTFRSSDRPLERAEMLLRAYFAGLVLFNLIPFDLTIHPNDLWEKFQAGRIVLMPFQGFTRSSAAVFEALLKGLITVPVGMLAVTIGSESRRTPLQAALVAVGLVAAIEMAQIFIESRFSATTDVIIGGIGALIGVRLERLLPALSGSAPPQVSGARLRGVLAVAYLIFPCCVLWWPLNFSADSAMIKAKLQRVVDVPLNQLIIGQAYLKGLSQITERIVLFLPFGLLVGAWLADWPGSRRIHSRTPPIVGVSAITLAAIIIEAGQVFVPDRIPDGADVLLAMIGGLTGLFAYRLITPRELRHEPPIRANRWTRTHPANRRR